MGFTVDIYDGKLLIDSIDRLRMPASQYPFVIGDELVSMDGIPVEEWLTRLRKYNVGANERSTRRLVAGLLTSRGQSKMPLAPRITPNTSTIVVRRAGAADGETQSYEVTWQKTGTEMEFGPLPMPRSAPVTADTVPATVSDVPALMPPVLTHEKDNATFETKGSAVLNIGGRNPIFVLPANFQRRLGGAATDEFFSGTFEVEGRRIGFIRIPRFTPNNINLALNQFLGEVITFQTITDGLIIDVMRNPGGSVTYLETLMTLIMPNTFRTLGYEIRATNSWIASFSSMLSQLQAIGAPTWQIDSVQFVVDSLKATNSQDRGKTGPLPLSSTSSLDLLPFTVTYTKPIIVLADELSASGGDAFPAIVQDNKRGLIVGMRTLGAGGTVASYRATGYTEAGARVTESLMNRKNPVTGTEFPDSYYVENVGVRPDVELDYMTRENLLNGGRTFFDQVTRVMLEHLRGER